MNQNPYEPSAGSLDSSPSKRSKNGIVCLVVCWSLTVLGLGLIALSAVFVASNSLAWISRDEPASVRVLMLLVIAVLGSVPALIGFALQHYSRRYMRWSSNKHKP